jgi:hypothetical protein
MRALTTDEEELLERRKQQFEDFLNERMPVLADFMQRLKLPDPALVLVNAKDYLNPLDEWLRDQPITQADETWLITRLGYFSGEWLVQQLGGCWLLDDIPDSRYFARYVVGQFSGARNRNTMADPFEIAAA